MEIIPVQLCISRMFLNEHIVPQVWKKLLSGLGEKNVHAN